MPSYSKADKALHRLALNPAIAEIGFSIDQALASAKPDSVTDGKHVFVAGLARAGTTVLMRRIHESGAFRSLTYKDMPFVLAPNLWSKLRGRSNKPLATAERAHGDGLEVNEESPESLDEVFWRVFTGDSYIAKDRLQPYDPAEDDLKRFKSYVAAILSASGTSRYLSKNNNNILRLTALARAFPYASLLIPFRHPLAQARSLQAQHARFSDLHAEDKFASDYMRWLVHHEFGSDHRPMGFGATIGSPSDGLSYWVRQWCRVYAAVLETAPKTAIFVCYEDLCDDPNTWSRLALQLDLPQSGTTDFVRREDPSDWADVDAALRNEARALYSDLRARA